MQRGTRENAEGVDVNRTFGRGGGAPESRAILTANRDRKFALSIDLHEDRGASGFYCYEYDRNDVGPHVIAALDARGFAIQPLDADFDFGIPLDPAYARFERGLVCPDADREVALLGAFSYSLSMRRNAARATLTFETPAGAAWETRVEMHRTAVLAAISQLPPEG